jgi:hypothetical protein
MKRAFFARVWLVSVWIMNAMAAGPGLPRAPPSEKAFKCLWMFVAPGFQLYHYYLIVLGFLLFLFCCCGGTVTSFYEYV